MKNWLVTTLTLCLAISAYAQSAIAPKFLVAKPEQLSAERNNPDITIKPLEGGDFEVQIAEGAKNNPGVLVKPSGDYWDLSPWGRVQLKVTNIGKVPLGLHVRVDEYTGATYKHGSWSTEQAWLKPNQSQVVKVIFGYNYGFKPGYPLNASRIKQILLFTGNAPKGAAYRIEALQATGTTGEKPPVKPKAPSRKPKDGVFLSKSVTIDNTTYKSENSWDLSDYWHVNLTLRNPNDRAVDGDVRLLSPGGSTDRVPFKLGAKETKVVDVSFMPSKPWRGQETPIVKVHQKGTDGTTFDSRYASRIQITTKEKLPVEVVKGEGNRAPMAVPSWLGKRPPVPGNWKMTLNEEFNSLNTNLWNISSANYWDKRTHFSKDNLIYKDGKVSLRYERRRGWHCDQVGHKAGETDYACGILTSYGKWAQRYGYFEARMKLPTAPGLWPAFWTMPDRGAHKDPTGKMFWLRTDTKKIGDDVVGGMEFDIMEHLTAWGPHRFNIAFHWNGYGKEHLATGNDFVMLGPDAEGFITVGLFWEPGNAEIYGNGRLLSRWKNPRVADVPAYLIFYMVSGGWANNDIDDAKFPADFTIDYVRAWQRDDLATK